MTLFVNLSEAFSKNNNIGAIKSLKMKIFDTKIFDMKIFEKDF